MPEQRDEQGGTVSEQHRIEADSLDYYSNTHPPAPHPGCPYRRDERLRQAWLWSISIGVTLVALAIIFGTIFLAISSYEKGDPSTPRNNMPIQRD